MDNTTDEYIKSLLYTYADWGTIGHKAQPYHIELANQGQSLFYFGANHSRDPENIQYPALRAYWHEFLEKAETRKAIVLLEGGLRPLAKNEKDAIHKNSEAGFMTFLANKEKINVESPEPSNYDERQELLMQFSKEEIQYYYFARMVNQWLNLPTELKKESGYSFELYLGSSLTYDQKESAWVGFDFSLNNMKAIHKTLFKSDFNIKDKDFFSSLINPRKDISVINGVAGACSRFRDVFIIKRIIELWGEGKSIFAVFGGAHLILQERALQELLK